MMTWRDLIRSGGPLPDDTQLPFKDGKWAKSSQEAPLRAILIESLDFWFDRRPNVPRPYFMSGDSGIYWRLPQPSEPLIHGAVDPDWYYVPKALPVDNGRLKNSYVMWHERVLPLMVMEFTLPEDIEARDPMPWTGKFWIYEQGLGVPYYGIYTMEAGELEVFHLVEGRYEPLPTNARGHYEIPPLKVEVGTCRGAYWNLQGTWLRWWDAGGNLLPTPSEWVEEQRETRALQERIKRMEAQLRERGIDPDAL